MMTSFSPVMSRASMATRDAAQSSVRDRRVQACSVVAISTKGSLKRAFVDNNRPHDSLAQRSIL